MNLQDYETKFVFICFISHVGLSWECVGAIAEQNSKAGKSSIGRRESFAGG